MLGLELTEPLVQIVIGDFRILIGNGEILVLFQLDLRQHFEFGLEPQRFSVLEVHLGDIGLAHHVQVFFLEFLLQILGNKVLEHLLADVALELFSDQARWSFTGTETRELSALLKRADHTLGLAGHSFQRDRDFERMPATID